MKSKLLYSVLYSAAVLAFAMPVHAAKKADTVMKNAHSPKKVDATKMDKKAKKQLKKQLEDVKKKAVDKPLKDMKKALKIKK